MPPAVTLRAVVSSDLAIFYAHQQDPQAQRMAGFSARSEPDFLSHWSKILQAGISILVQ